MRSHVGDARAWKVLCARAMSSSEIRWVMDRVCRRISGGHRSVNEDEVVFVLSMVGCFDRRSVAMVHGFNCDGAMYRRFFKGV